MSQPQPVKQFDNFICQVVITVLCLLYFITKTLDATPYPIHFVLITNTFYGKYLVVST